MVAVGPDGHVTTLNQAAERLRLAEEAAGFGVWEYDVTRLTTMTPDQLGQRFLEPGLYFKAPILDAIWK